MDKNDPVLYTLKKLEVCICCVQKNEAFPVPKSKYRLEQDNLSFGISQLFSLPYQEQYFLYNSMYLTQPQVHSSENLE